MKKYNFYVQTQLKMKPTLRSIALNHYDSIYAKLFHYIHDHHLHLFQYFFHSVLLWLYSIIADSQKLRQKQPYRLLPLCNLVILFSTNIDFHEKATNVITIRLLCIIIHFYNSVNPEKMNLFFFLVYIYRYLYPLL